MFRKCSVCGKKMRINVKKGGKYDNGNYFGKMNIPVGKGEYKKTGTFKLGKDKHDVVKWTGKEKEVEYWECNECFKQAEYERWLEEKN